MTPASRRRWSSSKEGSREARGLRRDAGDRSDHDRGLRYPFAHAHGSRGAVGRRRRRRARGAARPLRRRVRRREQRRRRLRRRPAPAGRGARRARHVARPPRAPLGRRARRARPGRPRRRPDRRGRPRAARRRGRRRRRGRDLRDRARARAGGRLRERHLGDRGRPRRRGARARRRRPFGPLRRHRPAPRRVRPRRSDRDVRVPVTCELLTDVEVRMLVPPRPADAHKGDAGRLLVIAGSPGKSGAAHLALTGALRGGAGLVTLAARAEVLPLALAGRPEAMSLALPGEGALGRADLQPLLAAAREVDALAIGPGIPRGPQTGELLRALLERAGKPAIVDADGLNALADDPALLAGLGVPLLVTPHPGEMARLCGTTTADVQADRLGIAVAKARAWNATVVLKGARTVVADPAAPPAIVPVGNPGLATGGTGDVLAGLCGALLAGGLSPAAAGRVGAFVHGRAGDLAAARFGERGLVAGDLGEAIGEVWAEWRR